MICRPCREGADLARAYRTGAIAWYGDEKAATREVTLHHHQCEGCDCQHGVNVGTPPMVTDEKGRALRPVAAGEHVTAVLGR